MTELTPCMVRHQFRLQHVCVVAETVELAHMWIAGIQALLEHDCYTDAKVTAR